MNKPKKSQRYIYHIQNTSPNKITYSFKKTARFSEKKSYYFLIKRFSPNKYYDLPQEKSKRSTSIGYG